MNSTIPKLDLIKIYLFIFLLFFLYIFGWGMLVAISIGYIYSINTRNTAYLYNTIKILDLVIKICFVIGAIILINKKPDLIDVFLYAVSYSFFYLAFKIFFFNPIKRNLNYIIDYGLFKHLISEKIPKIYAIQMQKTTADDLDHWYKLYISGAINEDEYNQQKEKILSKNID